MTVNVHLSHCELFVIKGGQSLTTKKETVLVGRLNKREIDHEKLFDSCMEELNK